MPIAHFVNFGNFKESFDDDNLKKALPEIGVI